MKTIAVKHIPTKNIKFVKTQPRGKKQRLMFQDLREDIGERGQVQPIIVTPDSGGTHRMVDGERRTRACVSLGRPSMEAKVVVFDSRIEELETRFVSNTRRVGITVEEMADAVTEFKVEYRKVYPEAKDSQVAVHLAKLTGYAPKFFADAEAVNRAIPEMRKLIKADVLGGYVPTEIESAAKDPDFRVGMQNAYVRKAKSGRVIGALQARNVKADIQQAEATAAAEKWTPARKQRRAENILIESVGLGNNGHHASADFDGYMQKVKKWHADVKHWTAKGLSPAQVTEVSEGLRAIWLTFQEMRRAVTGKVGVNGHYKQ